MIVFVNNIITDITSISMSIIINIISVINTINSIRINMSLFDYLLCNYVSKIRQVS